MMLIWIKFVQVFMMLILKTLLLKAMAKTQKPCRSMTRDEF